MANFRQITPFIYVPDLEAAIGFFEDLLGFTTHARLDGYAYLHRDRVGIRLLRNDPVDGAPPGNRRFAYYIDVEDVDALYAELEPKLARLPAGDVHGPADKPYGQRELVIIAPDGNALAFGHAIEEKAKP